MAEHPPSSLFAVAVSGGADSLYTLVSLHEAGLPVMAVHGLFGQQILHDFCASRSVLEEAHEVVLARIKHACATLGVPLHVIDCTQEFMTLVVLPFVQGFAQGLTPNPCVLCNAGIKFGVLLEKAQALGATSFVTGHYARMISQPSASAVSSDFSVGCFFPGVHTAPYTAFGPALLQGADQDKDQSYFLALTSAEHLKEVIFPLGGRQKKEVLAALAARGITPPQPKESQEVCFIPGRAYREFIPFMAQKLGIVLSGPGPVFLETGQLIGTHKGLWQYTEGQRRGLGIGWKEPLHVFAKDIPGNGLYLAPKKKLIATGCLCSDVNILVPPSEWPETVFVKTRYRERPKKARVTFLGELPATQVITLQKSHEVHAVSPVSDRKNEQRDLVPDTKAISIKTDSLYDSAAISDEIQTDIAMNARSIDTLPVQPLIMRVKFLEPESAVAPGQLTAVYVSVCAGDRGLPQKTESAEKLQECCESLQLVAGGLITQVLTEKG